MSGKVDYPICIFKGFQQNQIAHDMYPLNDNNIHNLEFTNKFGPRFVIFVMFTFSM